MQALYTIADLLGIPSAPLDALISSITTKIKSLLTQVRDLPSERDNKLLPKLKAKLLEIEKLMREARSSQEYGPVLKENELLKKEI